jgi:hypothetical protein
MVNFNPAKMVFDSPSVSAGRIMSGAAILAHAQEPTNHLRATSRFFRVCVSGSATKRLQDGVWVFGSEHFGSPEVQADDEDRLDPNHKKNGQETRQHRDVSGAREIKKYGERRGRPRVRGAGARTEDGQEAMRVKKPSQTLGACRTNILP